MLFTNKEMGNFAKDPAVIKWRGQYFLYYTIKYNTGQNQSREEIGIGIAVSEDMEHWRLCGEIPRSFPYEKKGIGAPGAILLHDKIHLFYQTYGNGARDAICHAVSEDGIHFVRNEQNPVYHPTVSWSCGRAIDADVCIFRGKLMLYMATRDCEMKRQIVCGAWADPDSRLDRGDWHELDRPILSPQLPWEKDCIEAPAALVYQDRVFLFYAGAYNCQPQQIGCAVSDDGEHFTRIFEEPFLPNGKKGEWNCCESGHPYIFEGDGRFYLFYQGSKDMGKTFFISKTELTFDSENRPRILKKEE